MENPDTELRSVGARSFDHFIERWTSADNVTAQIYDPQALNKYTYVRNDPVNMVDPDGRIADCAFQGTLTCVTVIPPPSTPFGMGVDNGFEWLWVSTDGPVKQGDKGGGDRPDCDK